MDSRLAAILASDVVGYSRMMGEDEAGTLNALRQELFAPRVAEHHGRVVKLMDDVAEVWLSLMSRWRTWDGAIGVAAKMKTGVREWMIAGFCGCVALLTSCAPTPEPPVTALVTPEPALPARAQLAFQKYLSGSIADFKSFAFDPSTGSWGYNYTYSEPDIVINSALVNCKRHAKHDCKLYAIGDMIILDMADWQVDLATSLYKSIRDATNDDLRDLIWIASTPNDSENNDLKTSALVGAATLGYTATVEWLLDQGVNVNVKSGIGATALKYAASRGKKDTVKLLLASGADVDIKNGVGKTALILAVLAQNFAEAREYHFEDYREIIQLLKEAGAKE